MREILDIILEDPKAFIIDAIALLVAFAGWIALYVVLSCFIP